MAIGNLVINIPLFAHKCPFPGYSWALPLWFGLVWLSLCRCVCVQNSDAACSTLSGWQKVGDYSNWQSRVSISDSI